MPDHPPIVCSLSAAELPKRLEEIADLGRTALLDVRDERRRAQLRFAADPGIRERVEALAAAESECCAFLTIAVAEQPEAIVVTIDAPEEAELIIEELVQNFRGRSQIA